MRTPYFPFSHIDCSLSLPKLPSSASLYRSRSRRSDTLRHWALSLSNFPYLFLKPLISLSIFALSLFRRLRNSC